MPRDTMNRERIIEVRREDANEYYLVRLDPGDVGELEGKGIGERKDSHFVLRLVELIYLAMSGYRVFLDGYEIDVNELIKGIDNPHALTVYLDMRRRGYFIKPTLNGPVDFLVWDKGKNPLKSSPSYMIKIVTEGLGIQVMNLLNVLKYSESMGTQLVLALVSSEGVITYYKAFTFRPVKGD
ncbi:MAG: endonuclease [Vulcanisaeta sp. OSP_8]|jgi:tRNA intron endonuclease, catalytic C-terminal domain.|nr:MAG: endonuclease [Vulcanisaeta sp. OSP_8]